MEASQHIANKKNNPNLYLVLVDLKENALNNFYVFLYDDFSDKVNSVYKNYIEQPKRDGNLKKEVGFRWFDHKNFSDEDSVRINDWSLIISKLI